MKKTERKLNSKWNEIKKMEPNIFSIEQRSENCRKVDTVCAEGEDKKKYNNNESNNREDEKRDMKEQKKKKDMQKRKEKKRK
jgi:hypothetical protein